MLRRSKNSLLMPSSKCVVIPDEVIEQVLSFLPVKSLLRLRCVCKSWKILISDPRFIKRHLKLSARNPHITLVFDNKRILPFPVHRLLHDTITIPHADYPNYQLQTMRSQNEFIYFVGSYNGLLCFVSGNRTSREKMFYLWNPATNTLSNKISVAFDLSYFPWKFAFGYDNSTHTYKVVAFDRGHNNVKVFNFGNNVCRNIEAFPVIPFESYSFPHTYHHGINDGVYVSNTINWLAELFHVDQLELEVYNYYVDHFVIISLDLTTETYTELLPPRDFTKVPSIEPNLAVLMDSLCFSHDFNGTHFIIWQMKEFGVQDSWTQFLKISYQILPIIDCGTGPQDSSKRALFPLSLSNNGDTLILAWNYDRKAILYNLRDNTAVKIRITDDIEWFLAKDYVESLVWTC